MIDDKFEPDEPLDPQLIRAEQLDRLRDKYARLWRTSGNLDRIHHLEQLLERLLASSDPIEPSEWAQILMVDELQSRIRRALEQITREQLIDPILEKHHWVGQSIQREVFFRDKRNYRSKRIDYVLWLRRPSSWRIVALIEAKHEGLPPDDGLIQVKAYAAGRRERIPFVFSTNGRHFVQYDRRMRIQSGPYPLELFPKPKELAALL